MADVFQTGTDKTKGLAFIALFYLVDPFNGSFVHDIASDPIKGIGWIDDDPPAFKDIHDLLDESLLGILLVNIDKHYFHSLTPYVKFQMAVTANRRISNIEPQPATSSAESNVEGWFRFAQSFFKIDRSTLSFDPVDRPCRQTLRFSKGGPRRALEGKLTTGRIHLFGAKLAIIWGNEHF
jgi:hypothetical protein